MHICELKMLKTNPKHFTLDAFRFTLSPGFSLVEIIVVMSIISILVGLMWGNFFSSLDRSRDTKRKKDLGAIAQALELYFNDMKVYPTRMDIYFDASLSNPTITPMVIYMERVPQDPQGYDYCYMTDSNASYFRLYANLDNNKDSQLLSSTVDCGGRTYNYGISSSNTTP